MTDTLRLRKWDVRVTRRWSPLYFLTGDRVHESLPPVNVEIAAEFDDDSSAREFETAVRDLLTSYEGDK